MHHADISAAQLQHHVLPN